MANEALDNALATLTWARGVTLGLLDNIPADKLCHQLTPGGNHALWVAGHVAWTDEYFMISLGSRDAKLPESWTSLFGQGSAPSDDAAAYPAIDDIKNAMSDRREEVFAWFRGMPPERLAASLPEDYQSFAPNFCALITTMACHETLHAGQLTMIRKDLAIPPIFG